MIVVCWEVKMLWKKVEQSRGCYICWRGLVAVLSRVVIFLQWLNFQTFHHCRWSVLERTCWVHECFLSTKCGLAGSQCRHGSLSSLDLVPNKSQLQPKALPSSWTCVTFLAGVVFVLMPKPQVPFCRNTCQLSQVPLSISFYHWLIESRSSTLHLSLWFLIREKTYRGNLIYWQINLSLWHL